MIFICSCVIKMFVCCKGILLFSKLQSLLLKNSKEYLERLIYKGIQALLKMMEGNVGTICRDYGVVCIHREGQDNEKVLSHVEILTQNNGMVERLQLSQPKRMPLMSFAQDYV